MFPKLKMYPTFAAKFFMRMIQATTWN